MTEIMQRCVALAQAEDVRVEEWSDGTISTAFDLAGDTWRIYYNEDNGWITIFAPLLRLESMASAPLLGRLLDANIDLLAMRYAIRDGIVCLRGEISEQEFNDDEFRLISRLVIDAVKFAIQMLDLKASVNVDE